MKSCIQNISAAPVQLPATFDNLLLGAGQSVCKMYSVLPQSDLAKLVNLAKTGKITFPGSVGDGVDRGLQVTPTITYAINGEEPLNVVAGASVFSITDNAMRFYNGYQWITSKFSGWSRLADRLNPTVVNSGHATLNDGSIILIGGLDINTFEDSLVVEIYNPVTGGWTQVADAPGQYTWLVTLPNGKVLCAGRDGENLCDLYDPVANTWTATGAFPTTVLNPTGSQVNNRGGMEAVVVANGTKVLIAGGLALGDTFGPHTRALLYTIAAGTWAATAPLPAALTDSRVVVLDDGKVAYCGGRQGTGALDADGVAPFLPSQASPFIYIYDPNAGTWATSAQAPGSTYDYFDADADLPVGARGGRQFHGATKLANGDVLFFGGVQQIRDADGETTGFIWRCSAMVYNPTSNTWRQADPMGIPRAFPAWGMMQQANGDVLVATDGFTADPYTEVFYANNKWAPTAPFYDLSAGVFEDNIIFSYMPVLGGQPFFIPETFDYDFNPLPSPNLQYSPGLLPVRAQAVAPTLTRAAAINKANKFDDKNPTP